MTTFVLSQYAHEWHIYKFQDGITQLAAGISSEEKALELILEEAKKACAASQVLRVSEMGDDRIIGDVRRIKRGFPLSFPHLHRIECEMSLQVLKIIPALLGRTIAGNNL